MSTDSQPSTPTCSVSIPPLENLIEDLVHIRKLPQWVKWYCRGRSLSRSHSPVPDSLRRGSSLTDSATFLAPTVTATTVTAPSVSGAGAARSTTFDNLSWCTQQQHDFDNLRDTTAVLCKSTSFNDYLHLSKFFIFQFSSWHFQIYICLWVCWLLIWISGFEFRWTSSGCTFVFHQLLFANFQEI